MSEVKYLSEDKYPPHCFQAFASDSIYDVKHATFCLAGLLMAVLPVFGTDTPDPKWNDNVIFDMTVLRTGMPKAEVLRAIHGRFRLDPSRIGDNSFCVTPVHETPKLICDTVSFDTTDRVDAIRKRVTEITSDVAARAISQLYTILTDAELNKLPVRVASRPEREGSGVRSQCPRFWVGMKTYDFCTYQPVGRHDAESLVFLDQRLERTHVKFMKSVSQP